MPIIKPEQRILPSLETLERQGYAILDLEKAQSQDIRELHIGFLNMMPDAAFEATERQFLRLIAGSNQIAQFIFHPITVNPETRSEKTQKYIADYYDDFEQLKIDGLDALIITGANVVAPNIEDEAFFNPLEEIVDWAYENVTSILCSCLASHALLQMKYGIKRNELDAKRWGVFSHTVCEPSHPLIHSMNTKFDVCHSRFNEVSVATMEAAGLRVLVASDEAGAHLVTSKDGFRIVFLQGHPEYDTISLLKEYKREVMLFIEGVRDYPPFPDHYLSLQAQAILDEYQGLVIEAQTAKIELPDFPEQHLIPLLHNSWRDTANAFTNHWLGKVYQTTNVDRSKQFDPSVDPTNPLGLRI